MTRFDYDLFVIGAGSGGVRAGRLTAELGKRVAVAEEDRPGGTCVLRGCVPKKLMVFASEFSESFEAATGFGWSVEPGRFDWPVLRDKIQEELTRLSGIYRRNLGRAGGEILDTRAEIVGPNEVRLAADGRTVLAERILIAVGAWPFMPQIPGIEHAITSNEIFHMEKLPKRMIIVGGGYIAVEFAGIMNGLGVDTTLIYRGPAVLRGFDLDLRAMLGRQMEEKGIRVLTEHNIKSIDKEGSTLIATLDSERQLEADEILYATGRRPKTEGLGLENASVETNEIGAIKVDTYSQSSCPSIYAIGDVTDRMNLTPVAIREGVCFVETVYKSNPMAMDYRDVPTAVFSQPPIGTVGLTERAAREAGHKVDIYKTAFRAMRQSFAGQPEETLMKLVVDQETDRVLGCHLLGRDMGEVIQVAGIAVKMGATKAQFDATVAVHPTASEELVTMREKVDDCE